MNEFKKYIVIFDFVGFLDLRDTFSSKFKNITKLFTSLIKIMCIIHLLFVCIRDLLILLNSDLNELFFQFYLFFVFINLILV